MKLFPDDPRAAGFESKFIYLEPAKPPQVTAQAFEAWPPHMQTEFALLAHERGETALAVARRKTGVTAVTLDQLCARRHAFMLLRDQGYHVPDGAAEDPFDNPKRRRRAADAP